STRWSCGVPCKEQAGNRQGEPAIVFHSRRLVVRSPSGRARKLGRSTLVSRAQRSKKWHAASRPAHAIASDAFVALFTFQTAHLVPAARLRPGFASLLHRPRMRGGRSADPPPVHPHVTSGCPRLLQRLRFLLLRRPHAASTILRVHRFELG